MREILFREKRLDNGKWAEGYYMDDGYINQPFTELGGRFDDTIEVDPETVGQYTGLTDKNGKKIFEGDIIRYANMYDYNCHLESLDCIEAYDNIDFGDIWTVDKVVYGIAVSYPAFDLNMHNFESNGLSELSESGDYYYEVIGNIHDNPELLKGGAENGTK